MQDYASLAVYESKLEGDEVTVEYSRSRTTGIGRRVARGPSLANFTRRIRATLAHKIYNDLDMFAAHFMLLISICTLNNWPCDVVQAFVERREANLQELIDASFVPMNRGDAKTYTTKLLYGASGQRGEREKHLFHNVPWVLPLVRQMYALRELFWNAFPHLQGVRSNHHSDPKAALMSIVINLEEDRSLSIMQRTLAATESVDVLVYDGSMSRHLDGSAPDPARTRALLEDCEQAIADNTPHDNNKIECKPFEDPYDLSGVRPEHRACFHKKISKIAEEPFAISLEELYSMLQHTGTINEAVYRE
jgi:hypothetical protein